MKANFGSWLSDTFEQTEWTDEEFKRMLAAFRAGMLAAADINVMVAQDVEASHCLLFAADKIRRQVEDRSE